MKANFKLKIRDNHPDVGCSEYTELIYEDLGDALIAKNKLEKGLSSYITVTVEKMPWVD